MTRPQQRTEKPEKAEKTKESEKPAEALREAAGETKRTAKRTAEVASAETASDAESENAAGSRSKPFLIVRRQKKTARTADLSNLTNQTNLTNRTHRTNLPDLSNERRTGSGKGASVPPGELKDTKGKKDSKGTKDSKGSNGSKGSALPCPSSVPPQTVPSCSDSGVNGERSVSGVNSGSNNYADADADPEADADAGSGPNALALSADPRQTPPSAANAGGFSLIQHRTRRKIVEKNVVTTGEKKPGNAIEEGKAGKKAGKEKRFPVHPPIAASEASKASKAPDAAPDKDDADREAGCGTSPGGGSKCRAEKEKRIGRKAASHDPHDPHDSAEPLKPLKTPETLEGEDSRETPEFPGTEAGAAAPAAAGTKRRTAVPGSASGLNDDICTCGDVLTPREIGQILRHNCTPTRDELGEPIRNREAADRDYYIGRDAAEADTDEALRAIARKHGATWGCVVWNKARVGCEYADYAAAEWLSLGALFENYAESLKSYRTTEEIIRTIRSLCTRYFHAVHGPIEIPDMKRLQLFVFEIAESALDVPAFRSTMCLNAISVAHPDVVDAVLEMILPKNLREALREYEPLRASAYWREGTEPGREVIDELRAFWKSIVMPVPAQNEHGAQAEPARGGRR